MRRAYMHNLYILGHAKIASSILAKSTLLMLSTFIVLLQEAAISLYSLFYVYHFSCLMIVSAIVCQHELGKFLFLFKGCKS
jgi:hypothetical protein